MIVSIFKSCVALMVYLGYLDKQDKFVLTGSDFLKTVNTLFYRSKKQNWLLNIACVIYLVKIIDSDLK